jgi:hypothetical protein
MYENLPHDLEVGFCDKSINVISPLIEKKFNAIDSSSCKLAREIAAERRTKPSYPSIEDALVQLAMTYEQGSKIVDEAIKLPNKEGNRILIFSASVNNKGHVSRYSMAYINHNIFRKDNGRVV